MALNLSGADKTFRRYAAIEGRNHPPIHPSFVHQSPAGDAAKPTAAATFTAVAATDLLTSTAHGLAVNTPVRFTSTTTLPNGLVTGTTYYVIASGLTADDFKVSATLGGTQVDITSTGTGTHSWTRYLSAPEQAQVDQWLRDHFDDNVTLAAAILMINAWNAYNSNPQHLAWIIDDALERHWQWIWRSSDHADGAQAAVPPSASNTGTGSGAPASPANPSPN